MKRRIFRSICIVALFSILIATWTTTSLLGQEANRQTREEVKREICYLSAGLEESGAEYFDELDKIESHIARDSDRQINRITWIAEDGNVIYDLSLIHI